MTDDTVVLTDDEIATLNQARDILAAMQNRLWSIGWKQEFDPGHERPHAVSCGIVYGTAMAAADLIFDVLNQLDSRVQELPDDQLHNRKPEAVA